MKPLFKKLNNFLKRMFTVLKPKSRQSRHGNGSQNDNNLESILVSGIQEHMKHFIGLYEPVYQVAQGNLGIKISAFGEWCLRVENLGDSEKFKTTFLESFSDFRQWDDAQFVYNAKRILEGIYQAGIIREDHSEITIDEMTYLRYAALDGRNLISGEVAEVFSPCWYCDTLILGKGILK
jgi:hypothetical protein